MTFMNVGREQISFRGNTSNTAVFIFRFICTDVCLNVCLSILHCQSIIWRLNLGEVGAKCGKLRQFISINVLKMCLVMQLTVSDI